MHIINAVKTMGNQMGIDLALSDQGTASLNVGETDSLFIERDGDSLAVSLARKIQGDILPGLERGLMKCHPDREPRLGLRVALFREDTLVVISKLEKHHINAGMVEQILPYLFETMAEIS